MATTRTDALLAIYVLRALDYEVSYTEDVEGARPSANLSRALRAFQGAANREHQRALRVDGVLGNDTLNALAFYATQSPHAVPRLSSNGLTAEEQRAVQTVINNRRNIPWGMSSGGGGGGGGGGSSTSTGGGGSSTSTGGGGSSTSNTSQASMFGTGAKAVLVLGVLGALALGGAKAMERYEDRRGLPAPVERAVAYGRSKLGGRKSGGAAREVPAGPPPAPPETPRAKAGKVGGGVLGAVAALKRS